MCMYVYITKIDKYICMYMYIYIHTYIYTYTYRYIYKDMSVCRNIYICVCGEQLRVASRVFMRLRELSLRPHLHHLRYRPSYHCPGGILLCRGGAGGLPATLGTLFASAPPPPSVRPCRLLVGALLTFENNCLAQQIDLGQRLPRLWWEYSCDSGNSLCVRTSTTFGEG